MAPRGSLALATALLQSLSVVRSEHQSVDDLIFDDDSCNQADESCHLQLLQVHSRKSEGVHPAADSELALESRGRNVWPEWPVKGVSMPKVIEDMKYTVNRPIKMAQWTNWGFLDLNSIGGMDNCSWKGGVPNGKDGVVRDPDFDLSDVDVVLFHLPNLVYDWPNYYSMPRAKLEGQLWYGMCGEPQSRPESGVDCRLARNSTFMAQIDGLIGFSLTTDDIPAIQDPVAEEMLRAPIPDFAARGPELATVAISDCLSKTRQSWMQGVFDAFEAKGRSDAIISYGKCLHTTQEPVCHNNVTQRDRWMNPCASRPFKLVGENIKEDWYVTEKVWDALGEGTIPVYWGPKQVKLWMPPDSIIFADDYESEDALVDRMLSFTEADFQKAWAWKSKPVTEWGGYNKAWKLSHETVLPRVCEAAAKTLLDESVAKKRTGRKLEDAVKGLSADMM